MIAHLDRGGLSGPKSRSSVLLALVGLVAIEILVAMAVYANIALILAGLLIAAVFVFTLLRHPSAVAYLALGWLVFEKAVGVHLLSYSNDLSTVGDGLLVFGLSWTIIVNLILKRYPVFSFRQIGIPVAAFLAICLISTVANSVPLHVAELGTLSTVHSMIIFLILVNIGITTRDVRRFSYAAVGIMAIAAVIGILQAVPHSPAWIFGGVRFTGSGGLMRVDGPFEHPISFGDYLAMTSPLAMMLLFFGNFQGGKRLLLATATVLMLLATLLTFTREAWLAIPLGMLFLGLTVERKLLHWFVVYVIPLLLVVGLLFAPFATRLLETTHGNLRLTLLKLSLPLIGSHLLFGVGPGRFGGHVALITHTPLYAQYGLSNYFYGTGNQIDMFWTHMIAEVGVLGTLAYLACIAACFILGRRAYLRSKDPKRRALLLGYLYVVPVTVFVSFVSATLEAGPGATLFWGLMGMMTVLALSPEGVAPSRSTQVADG